MILSGQVSSTGGGGGDTKTVCVEFEDALAYRFPFYDKDGNILDNDKKNYIPKDSYIYCFYSGLLGDKTQKLEDYWTLQPMSRVPFKFKITKDVVIPLTIASEWNEFSEESGIISDDLLSPDFISQFGAPYVETTCPGRFSYFTQPEKTYTLTEASQTVINNLPSKDVLVFITPGTSGAESIYNSINDIVSEISTGLRSYQLSYNYVVANKASLELGMRLGEQKSQILCALMPEQERIWPFSNNISALIRYKPTADNKDLSTITYMKNIRDMVPVEYGANIAGLIHTAYTKKASGHDLYDIMRSET